MIADSNNVVITKLDRGSDQIAIEICFVAAAQIFEHKRVAAPLDACVPSRDCVAIQYDVTRLTATENVVVFRQFNALRLISSKQSQMGHE
jgi:hypothetical protein